MVSPNIFFFLLPIVIFFIWRKLQRDYFSPNFLFFYSFKKQFFFLPKIVFQIDYLSL